MHREWQKYGIAVMVTSFTPLILQWVLPSRMVLSVGEMPSLLTGYRLVTRVLHMHITAGTLVPAVLMATSHSCGNGQNSTPHKIQTPQPITIKLRTIDYVHETNS